MPFPYLFSFDFEQGQGHMTLTEMIDALEIEVSNTTLWTDADWTRAINKTINLMSRFIPKKSTVETIIIRDITAESITIVSGAATLVYKPVKKGTVVISGKTEDTDFSVNYLTGVITALGTGLPDGTYTVNYNLDSQMYNLEECGLTDFIKIDSIEYPIGETPLSKPTFDVQGNFLVLRGNTVFSDLTHLRITYLSKWIPPLDYSNWTVNTTTVLGTIRQPTVGNDTGFIYECTARTGDFKTGLTEPTWGIILGQDTVDDAVTWTCRKIPTDYPSHLDDLIIIGAVGQALLQKAEKYTQDALSSLTSVSVPTPYTIVKPTSPTFPTAPTSPTLATLTAPAAYTLVKPTSPTFPTAPTAPSAPTISFTDAESAMAAIASEITAAKVHHTTGAALANANNRGENPASIYGQYAATVMEGAAHRSNEAIARLRELEETLTKYGHQVTSYGSDVNAYANTVSGMVGRFNVERDVEVAGATVFSAAVSKYQAQIQEQGLVVNKYGTDVQEYASQTSALVTKFKTEIDNEVMGINNYIAQVNSYQAQIQSRDTLYKAYLDIAGRYLASGQSKVNEFLAALGIKPEFIIQRATSEQR